MAESCTPVWGKVQLCPGQGRWGWTFGGSGPSLGADPIAVQLVAPWLVDPHGPPHLPAPSIPAC